MVQKLGRKIIAEAVQNKAGKDDTQVHVRRKENG